MALPHARDALKGLAPDGGIRAPLWTKDARRKIKRLSKKESRFRRRENHCISKTLVEDAKRTGRGTGRIESTLKVVAQDVTRGCHS